MVRPIPIKAPLPTTDDVTWTTLLSQTGAYVNTIANGGTDFSISTAGNFHRTLVLLAA